jgi:hypothetical protein
MAVGAIVARILTQYSDKGSKAAQKDIANLGKNFDAFAKKSARAFGLAAAASAVAAAKIGKDAVMAASDVSQQFGALDAVFGQNSIQLKEFSKSMVDYGLSTAEAARYAALLGTQLKGLGMEEEDAITRTKQLQILAADLAATYGGTTADAVAALSSTFKGEYNPIERYGVAIRKSDITARVAAKGLGKLQGELLKSAEAQAAFELIVLKTTAAQGQSRREYNTLAAQLQRVNASYENIKATLGLALLPVVEKFADYVLKNVLPGLEKWVETNKDQLAKSLQTAAQEGVKLFLVALKIGEWVVNNTDTIKTFAIALASIWATSKVYAFAKAIGAVTVAFRGLSIAALGTGAAGGLAAATAGAIPLAIAAGIGALTFGLSKISPGEKARAKARTATGILSNPSLMPMSPGASDVMNGVRGSGATGGSTTSPLSALLDALNKNTNAVKKNTKTVFDIATENAMKELAARQKALSGSASIAIGGGGKIYSTRNDAGKIDVNVYAGNVVGSADALIEAVETGLATARRRNGSGGGRLELQIV